MARPKQQARSTTTQEEIRQNQPFSSPAHEALIALMLTSERVQWPLHDLMNERGGLTSQQYNVLRILRGAGRDGLPTLEIASRMIERTPGITRMIDRLEGKGLVERVRDAEDRRQVFCHITKDGLALLRSLDRPIEEAHEAMFAALNKTETRELIRLLDKLRNGLA